MTLPNQLLDGYRAFRSGGLRDQQERYRELAETGQSPEVMVIGCCDSRVAPETIFNARPGELFVVRNVANLVPPYTPDGAQRAVSAALEFAVQALKVRHIVVLGHERCGGIRAYTEPNAPLSPGDFIGKWMALIAPAAEAAGPEFALYLARRLPPPPGAGVDRQTLDNLMTFPCVRILVERGKLSLHGVYFGVATGELSVLDGKKGKFTPAYLDQAGA